MNDIYSQLLFYLNGLWQRRWVVLGMAWVTCVASWIFITTIPDTYSVKGRMYVDTLNVLQPLLEGLAVENDVASELEVMKQTLLSRPNLEKVARVTDLDLRATSQVEMDALIDELRESIKVGSNEQNLFTITADGHDAVKTRDVVQSLITIFVETNLGENRSDMDTARQFIDDQIRAYQIQLEEAEQRRARFKQRNLHLLPGVGGYHGRLERAREELAQTKAQLSEHQERLSVVLRELATTPEYLSAAAGGRGPPSLAEVQIADYERQLQDLLIRYTEKHPDVIRLKERLEALYAKRDEAFQSAVAWTRGEVEQGSSSAESDLTDGTYGAPNPIHAHLRLRSIEQEANVAILRKRMVDLEAKVEEIESLASSVPIVEAEYEKLNRDYNVLSSKYNELVSRRESAKITLDREVNAEKVQFRVVEPPQVPTLPSAPNRPLLLAGSTFLSLGVGIGFAFLFVALDTTFASARHLRSVFDFPIYGSVSVSGHLKGNGLAIGSIILTIIAFITIPIGLGVMLVIENEVGLRNLEAASLVDPNYVAQLFDTVVAQAKLMADRLIDLSGF